MRAYASELFEHVAVLLESLNVVTILMNGCRDGFVCEVTYAFLPEQDLGVERTHLQLATQWVRLVSDDIVRDAAPVHDALIVPRSFLPTESRLRMEVVLGLSHYHIKLLLVGSLFLGRLET